jgi:formylglycine-generating enzyme required for sulfatase activity
VVAVSLKKKAASGCGGSGSSGHGLAVDMVRVDGGSFLMGADRGERWETPAHRVRLAAFYMDRREVSNRDYAVFVSDTGHPPPNLDEAWAQAANWVDGAPPPGSLDLPAVLVDRSDAEAFCAWRGAHLPTTWEWEKGARGADGRAFPWGAQWVDGRANLAEGGEMDGHRSAAPVDAFPEDLSPWGVEQMAGNVGEWVASDFAEDLRAALGVGARPAREKHLLTEAGIAERRGGHWLQPLPLYARTTVRWRVDAAEKSTVTGFRCAASRSERHH